MPKEFTHPIPTSPADRLLLTAAAVRGGQFDPAMNLCGAGGAFNPACSCFADGE